MYSNLLFSFYRLTDANKDWKIYIPKISPEKEEEIKIEKLESIFIDSRKFTIGFSDGKVFDSSNIQDRNIVIEVLIKYNREVDLEEYIERAFYFVNPQGELVNDKHESIQKDEYYEGLRNALSKHSMTQMCAPDKFLSDRTYPIN